MSMLPKTSADILHTVQVRDPNGHRSVFLEGLRSSTTIGEIGARATSELRMSADVVWNLRHESTGRLLQESQRLSEFAEPGSQVTLTLQPDAGLG